MPDIKSVADKADVIINGYAFTRENDQIRVLNLNNPGKAVVQNRGVLNEREIAKISDFIKEHYQEMYLRWSQYSEKGFYEK